jgi:hypothetical protein
MVRRHDDASAYWLLPEVIIKNLFLDALHDVSPKETNDRQIHSRIHQSERIAGSDNTIKRWQILEPPADNLNFRVCAKSPAKDIAKLFTSIYENQSHINGKLKNPTGVKPLRVSGIKRGRHF